MELNEGMNSGMTMISPQAPSNYHVAPNIDNSTPIAIPVSEPPPPVAAIASQVTIAFTSSSEKKKRGRPRKYDGAGRNVRTPLPMSLSASAPLASGNYFGENSGDWISSSTVRSFLPRMIVVNAGEDVSLKIISFSQQGPRAICILSAFGAISNVTLSQPSSSGGTLTYEGRFEILSLSGSFTPTESGGSRNRTGGMSVSLASLDGRVFGGVLAGVMIAATHVQVVVGSFLPHNHQELKQKPEVKLASPPSTYPAVTHLSPNPGQQMSATNQEHRNAAAQNPRLVFTPARLQDGALASAMDDSMSSTDFNISPRE